MNTRVKLHETSDLLSKICECDVTEVIGLSFKRPYLMKGLNLMITKSAKSVDFGNNHGFQHENCRFRKTTDFEKTADFKNHRFKKNHEICTTTDFYVKRKAKFV